MSTKDHKSNLCQYDLSDSDADSDESKEKSNDKKSSPQKHQKSSSRRSRRNHEDSDLPLAYRRRSEYSNEEKDDEPKDLKEKFHHSSKDRKRKKDEKRPSRDLDNDNRSETEVSTKKRLNDHSPSRRQSNEDDRGSPRRARDDHSSKRSNNSIREESGHRKRGRDRSPLDRNREEAFERGDRNYDKQSRDDQSGFTNVRSRMIDSFSKDNREKERRSGDDESRYGHASSSTSGFDDRRSYRNRERSRPTDRDRQMEKLTGGPSTAPPSYYKPGSKFAEQMQKRKLLWQGSKEKTVAHSWETMLSACTDEKQAEKLKKMIGMKTDTTNEDNQESDAAKKQEEIAKNLQQQYELARMSTHTHRGMGLGFTSMPMFTTLGSTSLPENPNEKT